MVNLEVPHVNILSKVTVYVSSYSLSVMVNVEVPHVNVLSKVQFIYQAALSVLWFT